MKSLKGSQTEKNILTAFAGESQARNRYDYFAGRAKNDGFVLVQEIFVETALQEKEHAKRLFKFLEGGDVEITAAYPAGVIADSEANLIAAASGENHEHTVMYPEFAATADKEGFSEVAAVMRQIAVAEAYPELKASENYRQLQLSLATLEDEIQMARRYYNGAAREQNDRVRQFPGNIVAGFFHFAPATYFELDSPAERAVPDVSAQ